jgi:hypothetical protein
MSIVATKTAVDSYGPLAWIASVVAIALEKIGLIASLDSAQQRELNLKLALDEEETEALSALSEEMRLLAEASKISGRDLFVANAGPLRSELRESFSTLVAIEKDFYPSAHKPDFEKTGNELDLIRRHVASGDLASLKPEILAEAQKACLELLEHLDNHRPTTTVH